VSQRPLFLKKLSNEVALTHTGPVELAAVGVSIALFNQASRIAIFPLVSVTTSFVAEEDAIGRESPEAQDCEEYLETVSTTNSEHKELIPKKGMFSTFYCFTLYSFLTIDIGFPLFVYWILLLVSQAIYLSRYSKHV
jgi:hypothetical protein